MASSLIQLDYQGMPVSFNEEGWFNATLVAEKFGKEPTAWLNQRDTSEYIVALASYNSLISDKTCFVQELNEISELKGYSAASRTKLLRLVKKTGLVKTRAGAPETGGGTWFHPKLAVPFARWLDVRFAVWCDLQIEGILKHQHPHFDWKRLRHEATSSFKVMNAVLQLHRQLQGKPSAQHHFINEAKLVNWALTGEFQGLDRERLSAGELDLLAKLEERNAVLIGCGLGRDERKLALRRFTRDWPACGITQAEALPCP